MGRFVVWATHREPELPQLTGFRGLFTDNGMSAHISAFGMTPPPVGDRGSAYRALILELANALKAAAEGPGGSVGEGEPARDLTAYLGEWPLRVTPAKPSTASVSGGGVQMTVYVSAHGMPPDAFEIQVPMTPDEAQKLASDLQQAATAAKTRMGR
jgi:hypothetical protein